MTAYVAVNENPVILCSYHKNEHKTFKEMGKLLKTMVDDNNYIIGVSSHYDDDGYFHLNVTMSHI